MKVVIEALHFPDGSNFPMVADVHYCLKGNVAELNGQMRIPVPTDFIEEIQKEVTCISQEPYKPD